MLSDGFHDVPPGKLATVVTHLEMTEPAALRGHGLPAGVELRAVENPEVGWYRDVFHRVGSIDWLWQSRLRLDDAALAVILRKPEVKIFTLQKDGQDEALLELNFGRADTCELAFFGLTRALFGSGAGAALMDHAISQAWARPIQRFHLHTCTLDHPDAMGFYRRSGFTPVRQQIEILADPRTDGLFPADYGPRIPRITSR